MKKNNASKVDGRMSVPKSVSTQPPKKMQNDVASTPKTPPPIKK
jgi:hypothetical protein